MRLEVAADGNYLGGVFNEIPEGDDPQNYSFYGSVLSAMGATREDVVARLKQDPYTIAGVWDWDKAQILPVS